MMDQIIRNPFRTLGVFIDSPVRDIVANKAKINAFSRVGKAVSYPLDLDSLLGAPDRTPDSVGAADSALAMGSDRLKAAQFWFMSGAPDGSSAFECLSRGDVGQAIALWSASEDMASLQNCAVAHLIKGDVSKASVSLSRLYAGFLPQFLKSVGAEAEVGTLVENYVTAVTAWQPDVDSASLYNDGCSPEWNEAAASLMTGPLIKKLQDEVEASKSTSGQSPEARLRAGRHLAETSGPILSRLREVLGSGDLQLVMISDKVGEEILQCGIDWYNGSDDRFACEDALELARTASTIVMGPVARTRFKENAGVLVEAAKSLPPKDMKRFDDQIAEALGTYNSKPADLESVKQLLSGTRLQIEAIGRKYPSHPYFVRTSSSVVNAAINGLVSIVNASQTAYNVDKKAMSRKSLKKTSGEAIRIMNSLFGYTMDWQIKQRLDTNIRTLSEVSVQVRRSDIGSRLGCLAAAVVSAVVILIILVAAFA